jgi:hypothetical protein
VTEPRKPIFGFLWPKPDPHAPVDGDYRQLRRVRVSPRGPIRIAALTLSAILLTIVTGLSIVASASTGLSPVTLLVSALAASTLVLVLRGWVVGTYVTDLGVTVETTWRHTAVPWTEVSGVVSESRRCPLLGLPVPVPGERSVLHLADGRILATHVYRTSPDLWLRPEAYDMARLRLERWQDAG